MANNYKNQKLDITSTNITTFYTCPASTSVIFKSILISNDSGSEDTITLTITDSASAVFSVYKLESVGSLSSKELLTQPLVLTAGEIFKVTAATANRLHVIASYLEIT